MTIRMDEGAAELLDTLHRAGYAAYVVGGCVRDSLLGLTPHDVAEHYLGADLLQILRGQAALDGTGGGNILEGRGLHRAVHGLELTPPGVVLLLEQLKSGQRRHKFFPFCVRKTAVQPCAAGQAAGSEVVDTELPKRFRQCFGLLGERVLRDHRISIASPKEKKRYFSSTATL